jgi:hypothetical protein
MTIRFLIKRRLSLYQTCAALASALFSLSATLFMLTG